LPAAFDAKVDNFLRTCVPSHAGQVILVDEDPLITSTSKGCPQSLQRYSNSGIITPVKVIFQTLDVFHIEKLQYMPRNFWISVIGFISLLIFSLWWFLPRENFLLLWLAGINLLAFGVYWYDKAISGGHVMRVPEIWLLVLAFAGGWPLAYISMRLFRHKTGSNSADFRLKFWGIVILELILAGVYWF
jgi:uncharacterized membrane protein YsdA (DUF1294 family)